MTFMVHPLHGATNISPSEVEAHEKNGWFVSTHEEWMAMNGKVQKVEEPSLCDAAAKEPAPVRRGRPPKAN